MTDVCNLSTISEVKSHIKCAIPLLLKYLGQNKLDQALFNECDKC